jgi:hypothetical protein
MAARDWATWHLNNQPVNAMHQPLIGPCVCHVNPCRTDTSSCRTTTCQPCHLSCHISTSLGDVTHATCHPFSGDMCHFWIGPTVPPYVRICLTCVASWCCHVSSSEATTCHILEPPRHLYRPATCCILEPPHQLYGPATSTVQT